MESDKRHTNFLMDKNSEAVQKYTYQNSLALPDSIKLQVFVEVLLAVDRRVGFDAGIARAELKIRSIIQLNVGPIVEANAHDVEPLPNILYTANFLPVPVKY